MARSQNSRSASQRKAAKPRTQTDATRSSAAKRSPRARAIPSRFRTYRSAINFLNSATDYERMSRIGYNHTNFNLSRMSRLLAALDNPHRKFRSVHIAGTKGKGSTTAMLGFMLRNCGFKVGLYTSPHLLNIRERIQIDQEMISERGMTRILSRIAPIARKTDSRNAYTFFEILTAVAFLHFAEAEIDIAIVETGLGGRLDSTNVLSPEVCGITSISFDHQQQLGGTLAKIAEEKAGIFKPGVPIISAPQKCEVKSTLKRVAEQSGSLLRFAGDDIDFSYRFESSRDVGPHTRVCVTTDTSRFEHLHVPLMGEHQAVNCGVALGVMDALKGRGFAIEDGKAIDGLAEVTLPGRMEMICSDPRILVDGAHNAASIEALMRAIGQNIPYDSMVVVFSCQSDKDIDTMLAHIQLGADKVIFTKTGSPRCCDPHELAARFVEGTGKMAQVAPDLEEAMRIARSAVTRDDLICVTGSFYLVGAVKSMLAFRPAST